MSRFNAMDVVTMGIVSGVGDEIEKVKKMVIEWWLEEQGDLRLFRDHEALLMDMVRMFRTERRWMSIVLGLCDQEGEGGGLSPEEKDNLLRSTKKPKVHEEESIYEGTVVMETPQPLVEEHIEEPKPLFETNTSMRLKRKVVSYKDMIPGLMEDLLTRQNRRITYQKMIWRVMIVFHQRRRRSQILPK
ncbi:2-phospho-L-lactate transferase [Sesbania bispinosa]|nr:2-phospho-L-lactate transferase [Sesbania bispinosa]